MDYDRLCEVFMNKDELRYWQAYLFVYCCENDIDVDTKRFDELVGDLYDIVTESWSDFDMNFDKFYNKMCELIV